MGTQVLLANPVCLVAYTIATFIFFHNRVPFEEAHLIRFFGDDYREYKARTYLGIPFLGLAIGRK